MSKRLFALIGTCIMAWSFFAKASDTTEAKVYFVAPNGKDTNAGTKKAPFATLPRARDAARELGTNQVRRIVVRHGDYYDVSLLLDARDSRLMIVAEPGETPMLYGGRRVTGWVKDGDKFYAAKLPGVTNGTWDFRHLVVDGQLRPRARLPESGEFKHLSRFGAAWHTTVGGGFRGKDKPELKMKMKYKPGDLGPWLDINNAELTIYHQWDDSIVKLKSHDLENQVIGFSNPSGYPPGAFGVQTYVVWNIREGMHKPGQWYLDRSRGMVVYWPLPGQDLNELDVICPTAESVIRIQGSKEQPVTGVTLRGLGLSATTAPCLSSGFGAKMFAGAVEAEFIRNLRLVYLTIANVGGQGIRMQEYANSVIEGCTVVNTGACGIRCTVGVGSRIVANRIASVGRTYTSAIGLVVSGGGQKMPGLKLCRDNHVLNNEISDAPYIGIQFGGWRNRYERNLVYDVMNVLRDGAAFYGAGQENVLRGNMVQDIPSGKQAHGYYIDELGEKCLVENNATVNCEWPVHMHMAKDNVIRNNLFLAGKAGNLKFTFVRCRDFVMDRNIAACGGPIAISGAGAVSTWTNNLFGASQYKGVPGSVKKGGKFFADATSGDYRFHADSPAHVLGIKPLHFRDVGPDGIER